MFEINVNGTDYPLRFGMGFIREANKRVSIPIDGAPGASRKVGLRYIISDVMDGDIEALEDVILLANKTETPKIKKDELEKWLEEDANIDTLFEDVLDFFEKANTTKRTIKELKQIAEMLTEEALKAEA